MKMYIVRQKHKQRVQLYYDRSEKLFVNGIIINAKRQRRFLTKLRPELRKLLVIRTYQNMDELLTATIEVEKVLGEIGETPYEPLQEKREEVLVLGETNIDKHLQVLNDTLVNYFGKGRDGKVVLTLGRNNTIQCQLCRLEEHITFTCFKLTNLRLKCTKCGGGHRIENRGLKCSFCLGMGHIEN
jgi:hypothetical protein